MIKIKFDDFIRLNRGFDLPDANVIDGFYPVVASTSIKTYHNQYKIEPPVVVTGRSGSLGKVQYIREKCWPLNTSLYVKDYKGNYPLYVYYYLQMMHLEQYNAGAGVPTLNQNHLHTLKITIHERNKQEKIANYLYLYDLAIENNNKRIKILEQMAENLYKEWFVRFRFPGHEKTEFENGLPKGWIIQKLDKVFEIKYGKDHKNIDDGNIPILGSGGLMRYGNKAIYKGESVLIPRKGSLNNIMYMNGEFWTVDTMFYTKLLIDNIGRFAYYTLKNIDMESYNSGAALPSMTTDILYHLKIMIPDSKILSSFNTLVNLFYKKIDYLKEANTNLTKQRDLLLPRLMSGKLAC